MKETYTVIKGRREECHKICLELRSKAKRLLEEAQELLDTEENAPHGYGQITNDLNQLDAEIAGLKMTLSRENSNPAQEKLILKKNMTISWLTLVSWRKKT